MKRFILLVLLLTSFSIANATISKFSLYRDEIIIKEIPVPTGAIVLSGTKHKDSDIYYTKIKISKIDSKGNYIVDYSVLKGGYEPDIIMRNLDEDPESEYIVRSNSGGSGAYENIDILDLNSNRFNNIFSTPEIENSNNDFFNSDIGKKIIHIYFKHNKGININVDVPSRTELKDINHDGICELICYQKVWNDYHANTLGVLRTVYKSNGKKLRKIATFFESKILFFFNEVKNEK